MIQFVYYYIILFCFFIVGLMLVPCKRQGNDIFSVSLAGAGISVIICFYLSCIGMGFVKISRAFLIFISLIFMFKGIKKFYSKGVINLKKEDIFTILFCSILSSIPICLYAFWGVQFPYCDGYTYISIADYLLENGYRDVVDYDLVVAHPWLSQIYKYQMSHFRIGAQMVLSLFTGLFKRSYSIELFLPCTCAGIFLYGMAAVSMIHKSFELSRKTNYFVVVLCCLNTPIIIWLALYGFLPQIWGNAFFVMALGDFLRVEKWRDSKDYVYTIIYTSIGIACLCFTYNEMLPFWILSIFFLLMYKLFLFHTRREIIFSTIKCAVVSLIIVSIYLPGMINAVIDQMGAIVGWNVPYNLVTYIGYIFSIVPPEYNITLQSNSGIIYFFITILIFIILFIGISILVKKDNKNADFIKYFGVLSITYIIMLFYFRYVAKNPWIEGKSGNNWSVFKVIQYYATIALPFLAILLSYYYEKYRKIGRILIACFIGFNLFFSFRYMNYLSFDMKDYTGNSNAPLSEYYQLEEKYRDVTEVIELQNLPLKHRQLVTYFMKDHVLISDWNTDGYYGINADSIIEDVEETMVLYYDPKARNTVANLKEVEKENSMVSFGFEKGFYTEEIIENGTLRWSESKSCLILSNHTAKKIEVSFECTSATEKGGKLLIETSNGEKLIDVDISQKKQKIVFEVDPNEETIKLFFTFYGESTVPDEIDGRIRAFSIQNWEVEAIE